MKSFCAVVFAVVVVAVAGDASMGDLPMQNPDLFGGDMIGVDLNERNAIPYDNWRWPNAIIPYYIDPSVGYMRNLIAAAMNHISANTCIRFQQRNSNQANFVHFFSGEGCYSQVGMTGRGQPLSLGQGCNNVAIIIHEILHAIGFYHEQNRSDRDDYINIYWNNIENGMASQFTKLNYNQNRLFDTFDYNSIMLYGSLSFTKDGFSVTMQKKNGQRLREVHQKSGMAVSDVNRVRKLYGC